VGEDDVGGCCGHGAPGLLLLDHEQLRGRADKGGGGPREGRCNAPRSALGGGEEAAVAVEEEAVHAELEGGHGGDAASVHAKAAVQLSGTQGNGPPILAGGT
jgi:hypothetical protein